MLYMQLNKMHNHLSLVPLSDIKLEHHFHWTLKDIVQNPNVLTLINVLNFNLGLFKFASWILVHEIANASNVCPL